MGRECVPLGLGWTGIREQYRSTCPNAILAMTVRNLGWSRLKKPDTCGPSLLFVHNP